MQQQPPTPHDDAPHADSGGTRTPAGTTYGDFHPTRRHDRGDEPYADGEPAMKERVSMDGHRCVIRGQHRV